MRGHATSRSANERRIGVIANPAGRRWAGFAAAAQRAGLACSCIPWADVLAPGGLGARELAGLDLVRIDSPAEDAGVESVLCGRRRERGEILGAAAWAHGLSRALAGLADATSRWSPHPADIDVLMDKSACHARLLDEGLSVPPALRPVSGWTELREAMADAGWSRVFVKPRYGSSGAGVIALATLGERIRATAHLDIEQRPNGVRLFSCTRPVLVDDEATMADVVDTLAPEGLHVERWAPKVVTHAGALDLRVVCVAGRSSHVVARVGRGPLTNLQAGARRIDPGEARAKLGGRGFDLALETSERVAAVFPRSLQIGVDVGVLSDRRTAVVFEANAFGDLLLDRHDLHGRRRSTWDAQAAALADGWEPAEDPVAA